MSSSRAGSDWGRIGYGVDLQGDDLVLVRAERTRTRVLVTSCKLDDARWRAESAQGIPAAASLGPRESITQWLEVAFTARQKVLKVLPTVLDIQLPFPLEACVYEFLALRLSGDGRTRALGVAARLTDVERKLARLVAVGIDPTLLDQEGLALWAQSLAEVPAGGPDTIRVVVYEGVDRSTLVIGVGGEFRAAHVVRLEDGAQIRRLVRSGAGEGGRKVLWCWAGPRAAGRNEADGIPVDLGDGWASTVHVHADPGTFLARALASRVVRADPWRCNLRQGPLEHATLGRNRGRQGNRAAAWVLASGLLLCAVNAGATWLLRERATAFDRAIRGMALEVAGPALGAARGEQMLLIVKRRVAERRAAAQPYASYLATGGSQRLADVIQSAATNSLVLEQVALKADRIVVAGRGPDWDGAQPLARLLQQYGMKPRIEREAVLPDASVPFKVTGEASRE